MAVYLKQFETQAAYEAAESSLILPNVSLITDNNTVHYNPSSPVPPIPSHDYVEIGGLKWATMNIGANSVTDYGLMFQWGDTQGYTIEQCGSGEGQKYFGFTDYKFGGDEYGNQTKYNSTDGKTTLDASDDAAIVNWGGNWRIPTSEEYYGLRNMVTSAWTTDYQSSGVAGLVLTSRADSSVKLFFPAVVSSEGQVYNSVSTYWSSNLSGGSSTAYRLFANSTDINWTNGAYRCFGQPIRPVAE